jgi:hypothetical protein
MARVADLVWIRKRDHHCAEIAIDAYLQSASVLESGPVFEFSVHRLERALRLAALLSNEALFEKVVKEIYQMIARRQEAAHISHGYARACGNARKRWRFPRADFCEQRCARATAGSVRAP